MTRKSGTLSIKQLRPNTHFRLDTAVNVVLHCVCWLPCYCVVLCCSLCFTVFALRVLAALVTVLCCVALCVSLCLHCVCWLPCIAECVARTGDRGDMREWQRWAKWATMMPWMESAGKRWESRGCLVMFPNPLPIGSTFSSQRCPQVKLRCQS